MVELKLPWPPSELSPNSRGHFMALARAKKKYRFDCSWTTIQQRQSQGDNLVGKLRVELTFHRPNRRVYDRDNLLARMKSGLDGVADGLRIDDKRFDTIAVRVADEIGGFVLVRITGENHAESNQRPDGEGR